MSGTKYVGLDVHKATTVVAVVDEKGRLVMESILETKTETIRDFFRGLSGKVHATFEEGTQAAWLHDVITPLVAELVVCNPRKTPAAKSENKSDKIDAQKLARLLRMGELKGVYHGEHGTRTLKHLARNYTMLNDDCTRTMNRIKAIYRSQGISCSGKGVYQVGQRDEWMAKLEEAGLRVRAASLLAQLDALRELRKAAKRVMLAESRKHPAAAWIGSAPGLGKIRTAQLIGIVDTPHRFRSKRQFWSYVGLAVVTKTSAEYRLEGGRVTKSKRRGATRGLNTNCNHVLKGVFKGAANSAMWREPMADYYQGLLKAGRKPELARVSLARKLAAVVLTLWKKGECFEAEKLHKQPA